MSPQPSKPDIECDLADCQQADRITALEETTRELVASIGVPPDPSRGTPGSGIAGTVSQIAADVRELRSRGDWPTRAMKSVGAVLAVAVPLAGLLWWAAQHMRFVP